MRFAPFPSASIAWAIVLAGVAAAPACSKEFSSSGEDVDAGVDANGAVSVDASSDSAMASDVTVDAMRDATVIDASVNDASVNDASVNDASVNDAIAVDAREDAKIDANSAPDAVTCSTDLQTDMANCGQCSHSCLGGACAAGECRPFALATGIDEPNGLTIDSQFGYFTSGAANISKVSLTTPGTPTVIASQTFFANAGEIVQTIGIDETATYIAWGTTNTATDIYGISLNASGTPFIIAADAFPFSKVRVAVGEVYWSISGEEYIEACPFTTNCTAPLEYLASDTVNDVAISDFIVSDGEIFATLYDSFDKMGKVTRMEVGDTNSLAILFTYPSKPFGAVAVDATNVYFVDTDGDQLLACPRTGCAMAGTVPNVVATNQNNIHAIAVDNNALYWTAYGTGQVMKLAK
jgi:hypothetical protein